MELFKIITLITLGTGFLIFLVLYLYSILISIIHGAPYVPTTKKTMDTMIKIADIKQDQKLAELGSGDGRIVIAAAELGAIAHGFERSPMLVMLSRYKIYKQNLKGKAFIHWKNIFSQDYSSYDIIMLYGLTRIMKSLGNKLEKELKPGTKIISNAFEFPNWQYIKKEGNVFLYVVK